VSKLSRKKLRNIRLTLQYEGTNYNGWQRQKNTRRTIHGIIEEILRKILREKVAVIAAGRTDAGVHARQQVANFKTKNRIPPLKLQRAINSLLPEDVKVTNVSRVSLDFHSRYDVKEKTYRYTILNQPYNDVFLRRFVYHYPQADLNLSAMRKAGSLLIGKHDFSSFAITGCSRNKTNVRNIKKLRIAKKGSFIFIEITGRGFLHKMVRGIVGTLIEIGRGKLSVETLGKILQSRNRKAAGPTAPACGLCLMRVKY
jgi:tRNA pseudouridine38-40 synthase